MGIVFRALLKQDRDPLHEMLVACGAFTAEEVRVALEVLDAGLTAGSDGDYHVFAALDGSELCGYVCIGPTPMTASTWHLYWICVHPRAQRAGVASGLQRHAEEFVRVKGGERIVLETSSLAAYNAAHRFYENAGYRVVGRIPDFYKPNDDCIIYCKELHPHCSGGL